MTTSRKNNQYQLSNNSFKYTSPYLNYDNKAAADKFYQHFMKTGKTDLSFYRLSSSANSSSGLPLSNFSANSSSVLSLASTSTPASSTVSSISSSSNIAKSQLKGLKDLSLKMINKEIPGLGSYYLKPKFIAGAFAYESYNNINKALNENKHTNEAVVCGMVKAGVSTGVSTIGNGMVIKGTTGMIVGSGGIGAAAAVPVAGAGFYMVDKASKLSGEASEKACHASFKFARKINAKFSTPPREITGLVTTPKP